MDCSAAPRSLRLGSDAALPATRSGSDLRRRFTRQVQNLGIQEVLSAPRAPWQRAYVERVIGTIRRECLDHMIVFGEASLYQHVRRFLDYYHEPRTHLSL